MTKYMNEAQAWAELAAHMEGSGCIPTDDSDHRNQGLCGAIICMEWEEVISEQTSDRMAHKISDEGLRLYGDRAHTFLWEPGKVGPRIRFCKRMVRNLTKESRV